MTAEEVRAKARALLAPLLLPGGAEGQARFLAQVRPLPGDFAEAFAPAAVERARRAYAQLWLEPPAVAPGPGQTELRLAVAEAAQLATGTTPGFPAGYAQIAPLLRAGPLWVAFRLAEPGQPLGLAFDGLVHLEERFAWFPKPYRHLVPAAEPLSHYVG